MRIHTTDGNTGKIFEEDCLFPKGRIPPAVHTEEIVKKSFHDAMLECMKNPQYKPWELSDPPALWINDIHAGVADALGLEDYSALKIFPTLHTSADVHHHTDFLIVYSDPVTEEDIIVTADLTTNRQKTAGSAGADIVIYPDGAVAHPRFQHLGEGRAFHTPDIEHADKREERERRREVLKQTSILITEIIKAKLEYGERKEYQSLYHRPHELIDDARKALSTVMNNKTIRMDDPHTTVLPRAAFLQPARGGYAPSEMLHRQH